MVKNLPANTGDTRDTSLIPGWGRSPEGGNGSSLQCSCLENSMDRGAWWATVHGVADSDTAEHTHTHTHTHTYEHPHTSLCQPLPLSDPLLLQESSSWGNIYSLYSLPPLSFFYSLNHVSKCQGSGKEPVPSLPLQCYRTTSTYLRRSCESPRHFPEKFWPILFIKTVTKGIPCCIQCKQV